MTLLFPAARWRSSALLLASLYLLCVGGLASAVTITVNNSCTLAQAVSSANDDSTPAGSQCAAGSGADTIRLSSNVALRARLPVIQSTITVAGGGYTIDGADTYQIFFVNSSGNLTVNNVTLINSKASAGARGRGGAIFASGATVTLTNSRITASTADGGGGLYANNGATITISNSTIDNNRATQGRGGGVAIEDAGTSATLSHVTFYNNTGNTGSGIYLNRNHNVKLRNSIISDAGVGDDCFMKLSSFAENTGNLIADNACSPAASGDARLGSLRGSPGYFAPAAGSPAAGIGSAAVCAAFSVDQAGNPRPAANCKAGAVEYAASQRQKPSQSRGSYSKEPTPTVTPLPACTGELMLALGYIINARYGLCSGAQFNLLDGAGVGNAQLVAEGFIAAMDVWAYVEQGVEVCFPQQGKLVFLDAATAPRALASIENYVKDWHICAYLTRPGTLVMQKGPSAAAAQPTYPAPALANCMVTLQNALNFRETPNGKIIRVLPAFATLTAIAYAPDWFYVDFYGIKGWVSANYVTTQGNCI